MVIRRRECDVVPPPISQFFVVLDYCRYELTYLFMVNRNRLNGIHFWNIQSIILSLCGHSKMCPNFSPVRYSVYESRVHMSSCPGWNKIQETVSNPPKLRTLLIVSDFGNITVQSCISSLPSELPAKVCFILVLRGQQYYLPIYCYWQYASSNICCDVITPIIPGSSD